MRAQVAVTVMMPVWNQRREISTALASLLAQRFQDWTCVVVDDGSTDGSGDLVRAVADKRVQYIRLSENLGRGAARQVALDNCEGQYLAMLDADDWWYPWKLDQQVQLLDKSPGIGAVSSSLAVEDVDGEVQGVWRVSAPGSMKTLSPVTSARKVRVSHGAILIRRSLASDIGYDSRLRRSEDRLFLVQALSRVPYCAQGEVLYTYRPSKPSSQFDLSARYWWRARAYSRLSLQYPLSARIGCVQSVLQAGVAFALGFLGVSRRLTPRRPQPPTMREIEAHRQAWEEVQTVERCMTWGEE